MTTTDSAKVTPAAGGQVVVTAERLGARSPAAVRAERRAWLVLWLAFGTFCALVASVGKFAVDYVSTAQLDQFAIVTSSQGLIFVTPPGSHDRAELARPELPVGTVVSLERYKPGSVDLQLFDDSRLTILNGGTVTLSRMEVGRFVNQHVVQLDQSSGPIRYATVGPMAVHVPNGDVQLGPNGDYTVWIDDDATHVLVYGGEARLSARGQTITIGEGFRGDVDAQHAQPYPSPRQTPLLKNGDFAQHDDGWVAHDVSPPIDLPGQRLWVDGPEGLNPPVPALRVVRSAVKDKPQHGETGLSRKLDIDVSGYRHLWLRAWVRVDSADLSGGGTLGSEYPMLFHLQYEGPQEGTVPDWSIGFYTSNPDKLPVPESTATLWPQGEWRPYEVDLMATDAARVPYRLLQFDVMGQGHSFDARVADIQLIGD